MSLGTWAVAQSSLILTSKMSGSFSMCPLTLCAAPGPHYDFLRPRPYLHTCRHLEETRSSVMWIFRKYLSGSQEGELLLARFPHIYTFIRYLPKTIVQTFFSCHLYQCIAHKTQFSIAYHNRNIFLQVKFEIGAADPLQSSFLPYNDTGTYSVWCSDTGTGVFTCVALPHLTGVPLNLSSK